MDPDPREGRMPRIDEPIAFGRRQDRGNGKNRATFPTDELVPDLSELRRSGNLPPVLGELPLGDRYSGNVIGNVCHDYDQVLGRIVGVEVYEVFYDCQREVLGGIDQSNSRAGPASAKPVRPFAIERSLRIGSAEDSVYPSQLTPPYAIRPRTFSTDLAPSSVSINSIGILPPNARLARFSHRVAVSSSPR